MKISLPAAIVLGAFTFASFAASKAEAFVLVANSESNNIIQFDETTNTFLGDFTTPGIGGLRSPDDLTVGPDGNLYVSSGGSNSLSILDPDYPTDSAILKFSLTGKYLGVAAAGNGLSRPYGNAFGPDGNLYVSSFRTNQILRYDGKTGEFLGVFASDNNNGRGRENGLNGPNGLLFGPDGSLYVATEGTANDAQGNLGFPYASQILRYTPEQVAGTVPTTTPSVFVDVPTPLDESLGFVSLLGLALAPDQQSIFVSDFAGGIRQYGLAGNLLNVLSTNYTGTSPSNNFIGGLTFGVGDDSNTLYAAGFDFTNENVGSILAFDGATGSSTAFSGAAYTDPGLLRTIGIVAVPEPASVAGALLAVGGLGATWRRKRRSPAKS
ncbi:PEP-CTERM sorting domain-containing protein [Kovacikia minuta CCNUW1]|uniref:PEP-CTERM sorting domain-containing protein n=1 Tax=Kovacikia minuta TaxID=2931930 RepID=UPI001CCE7CBF|nr:PEP-CTERM sorting domain-containing protein [Kovacikia minuta]UBF27021.1 PEP-CTERM sorting domain-containing protein [Kovacikia minuta CCNUW1]